MPPSTFWAPRWRLAIQVVGYACQTIPTYLVHNNFSLSLDGELCLSLLLYPVSRLRAYPAQTHTVIWKRGGEGRAQTPETVKPLFPGYSISPKIADLPLESPIFLRSSSDLPTDFPPIFPRSATDLPPIFPRSSPEPNLLPDLTRSSLVSNDVIAAPCAVARVA